MKKFDKYRIQGISIQSISNFVFKSSRLLQKIIEQELQVDKHVILEYSQLHWTQFKLGERF